MLGILLIRKPLGITSHDVVDVIRRRLGTRRVGHAGTLDPLATGLLVVAVGPATRFLQFLPLEPKVYVGDIRFGIETNTQDAEGDVVREMSVPEDLDQLVAGVRDRFHGLIKQTPPMFSAVKKNGQPLYVLARKGEVIEREARTVHISSFELDWNLRSGDSVPFRVTCSGGTYVRTLAHDLGQAVGCGAHLSRLERTDVGRFHLKEAVHLDQVAPSDLIALSSALPPMPLVTLNDIHNAQIRQGRSIEFGPLPESKVVGIVDRDGLVFGVARVEGERLQPEVVIPLEAGV